MDWSLTYVGKAEQNDFDQVLDEVSVGPIPIGVNKFVFEVQ
jgi:histone chaperone ASF1